MRRLTEAAGVRAVSAIALLAVAVMATTAAGQTSQSDLVIGDISVRRVVIETADPAEGLDAVDAVVGEQLHLRAVVRNSGGETYERLRVDFYFTERITQEHGLLGSQTVFRLKPGEERLPAISVETSGFTPGFYVFTVAVSVSDFATAVPGELAYLTSKTQPESESTVIVARGAWIAELKDTRFPFLACQFGGIQTKFSLDARNVGTIALEEDNITLAAVARFGDTDVVTLDAEFAAAGLTPGNFDGTMEITLTDTARLSANLKPDGNTARAHFEVLGQFNATEKPVLELSVTPIGGTTQTVQLPPGGLEAIFFSELDAWQYPEPGACGCASEGECGGTPTTDPALRPIYGRDLLFHVSESSPGGNQYIHAMDPDFDRDSAQPLILATSDESLPSRAVTDPCIRYGGQSSTDPLNPVTWYHVYFGTADGNVRVHTLKKTTNLIAGANLYEWILGGDAAVEDWNPSLGDGVIDSRISDLPLTRLRYLEGAVANPQNGSDDALLVTGTAGIYVLDANTGALLQTVTDESVSHESAMAGGFVWYSMDDMVYGVQLDVADPDGAERCSLESRSDVTTRIAYSEADGTLFWGDDEGQVYALPLEEACEENPEYTIYSFSELANASTAGLTIAMDSVGDGDTDPEIFVTSIDGVVASIEYNAAQDRFEAGTKRTSQGLEIDGNYHHTSPRARQGTTLKPRRDGTNMPPVVLDAGDADLVLLAAVFDADSKASGKSGSRWALVALERDTDASGAKKWGTYMASTWGETVEYVLKLGDGEGPILAPTPIAEGLFVVTVPGERLYALKSGRSDTGG